MCSWVAPNNGALILHSILCRMEEWAARTYEGKRVPFGFVVDFGAEADKNAASYLHFLSNDSSAVFTDGVFSGIKLDRNGKILSFITRNTPVKAVQTTQEMFVPHQFSDIGQHCFGKAIGVIVLTNGEILLVKQCAICFAKRGTKWVSFDWDRVYSKLLPYFLMGADDLITAQKKIKIISLIVLITEPIKNDAAIRLIKLRIKRNVDSPIAVDHITIIWLELGYSQIQSPSKNTNPPISRLK